MWVQIALKLVRMEFNETSEAEDAVEVAGAKSGKPSPVTATSNADALVKSGSAVKEDEVIEGDDKDLQLAKDPEVAEQLEDLASLLRNDKGEIGADDPSVVPEMVYVTPPRQKSYLTQLLSSMRYGIGDVEVQAEESSEQESSACEAGSVDRSKSRRTRSYLTQLLNKKHSEESVVSTSC